MRFASPLVKQQALGSSFFHWIKSGVAYAGSHTAATAESVQKMAVPAAFSLWLSYLIEWEPAGDWCHDGGITDTLWACHCVMELIYSLLSKALDSAQG